MLSESRNSTCTVAKILVSEKTGFIMAAILAKARRRGDIKEQVTYQMRLDLINSFTRAVIVSS